MQTMYKLYSHGLHSKTLSTLKYVNWTTDTLLFIHTKNIISDILVSQYVCWLPESRAAQAAWIGAEVFSEGEN